MRRIITNIHGVALTKRGIPDHRASRQNRGENDNRPYMFYEVVNKSGDARPWHVVGYSVDSGAQQIISRHRVEAVAAKRAEQLRVKQPDRKPGVKALHKLGLPHK